MKRVLIGAMMAASLITTAAHAQTYNATGTERQAASNDMGMYQLTLEAFMKSQYYLHDTSKQARNVRGAFDTVVLAKGVPALVSPSGQIVEYSIRGKWYEIPSGSRYAVAYQTLGTSVGGSSTSGLDATVVVYDHKVINPNTPVINSSSEALQRFKDQSDIQRALYLSLADIAQSAFLVIRNKKMNKNSAVAYMSNQIDIQLADLLSIRYKNFEEIVMSSQMPGVEGTSYGAQCINNLIGRLVPCADANGNYIIPKQTKYVLGGFNEWTATFPDGVVIKNSYGSVDVSQNGRPWFSEAGIKGQKLSISGSSDRGSSTSQKRGE